MARAIPLRKLDLNVTVEGDRAKLIITSRFAADQLTPKEAAETLEVLRACVARTPGAKLSCDADGYGYTFTCEATRDFVCRVAAAELLGCAVVRSTGDLPHLIRAVARL